LGATPGSGWVGVERIGDRLLFPDPDGLALELVIDDGEDKPLLAWAVDVEEQVAIRGMYGVRIYSADPVRSVSLAGDVLGMEPEGVGRWLARGGERDSLVIYDEAPEKPGQLGAGTMHHVAFTIRDGEERRWRDRLAVAGLRPTRVLDRKIAKSIYFREPSRVLFELATDEPGFVFEPADSLGESLVLLGDLEKRRAELEERFPLLRNPRSARCAMLSLREARRRITRRHKRSTEARHGHN
jgi:glyoxalase family protein